MTCARVYDVMTRPTPYGYLAACAQHTALALHPERAVAEGLVVLAVVCAVCTQATLTPVAFRFGVLLD